MKKLLLFLFIVCITRAGNLNAQVLSLDTSKAKPFPSICDSGSVQSLQFKIFYTGPYLYNEAILINYRIRNSKTNVTSAVITDTIVPRLNTSDSIMVSPTLSILGSNGFFVDDDIVVIWPSGSGGIPIVGDSIIDTVHIYPNTTAGIKLATHSSIISLYPNPVENLLYLNYDATKINLEQVRIYDLFGRVVFLKTPHSV